LSACFTGSHNDGAVAIKLRSIFEIGQYEFEHDLDWKTFVNAVPGLKLEN